MTVYIERHFPEGNTTATAGHLFCPERRAVPVSGVTDGGARSKVFGVCFECGRLVGTQDEKTTRHFRRK